MRCSGSGCLLNTTQTSIPTSSRYAVSSPPEMSPITVVSSANLTLLFHHLTKAWQRTARTLHTTLDTALWLHHFLFSEQPRRCWVLKSCIKNTWVRECPQSQFIHTFPSQSHHGTLSIHTHGATPSLLHSYGLFQTAYKCSTATQTMLYVSGNRDKHWVWHKN